MDQIRFNVVQALKMFGWFRFYFLMWAGTQRTVQEEIPFQGKIAPDLKEEPFSLDQPLNVIVIQLESVDMKMMHDQVDDRLLLNNLNKLSKEMSVGKHFFAQHRAGGTQDAELSAFYSFIPNGHWPGFEPLSEDSISAIPHLLQKRGYETAVLHANQKSFYHRDRLLPLSGIQQFFDASYFESHSKPLTGYDMEFFSQALKMIKNMSEPFFAYNITLQTHAPFTNVTALSEHLSTTRPTQLEYYRRSLFESDYALGKYVEGLKSDGLWDRSIVVIFGDHCSQLEYTVAGYPYEFDSLIEHVPFLIHIPGMEPQCLEEPLSHYDIAPTVCQLLGIEMPKEWLGSSVFASGERNVLLNLPEPISLSLCNDEILAHPASERERAIIQWAESKQRGQYKIS